MLAPMNSVALITGGSRGIGRGIALELAGLGWDLAINYVSHEDTARRTRKDCHARARSRGKDIKVEICRADVGSNAARKRLIKFMRSKFGRLDLLVNNAGVAPQVRADILETTEESFDRVMAINAKGPYFLTQLAAKWMIEQVVDSRSTRPGPRIVTISSISAYTASINRGEYCMAKAAVSMMTSLYASRLAEYGIRVYEIRPGIIATDMTQSVREKYDKLIAEGITPIKRWGTPEDIGKAVSAIAQGLLDFSTGEVINADGGFQLRRL